MQPFCVIGIVYLVALAGFIEIVARAPELPWHD